MSRQQTDGPTAHKSQQEAPSTKSGRKKQASAPSADEAKGAAAGSATLVRVYRHGLGDCILIRLRKRNGSHYKILIDCGVAVATKDATEKMRRVVRDIHDETDGKLDVLAVTHQHWDHVSGFSQAEEIFGEFEIGEVWLAWTEDQSDDLAKKLRKEHDAALSALGLCAQALGAADDSESAQGILGVLGVSAAGDRTKAALDAAKRLAKNPNNPRYWRPTQEPLQLSDPDVRIFALGPPHDEKAIRRTLPSKAHPETFELALDGSAVFPAGVAAAVLNGQERQQPFSAIVTIPLEAARGMTFFQNHYWGASGAGEDWRRIDSDWLASADELAMALQSATNNTSLVLAIELANDEVLLFAADAQVGNWLSWQDLRWDLGERHVTGPDLLARTVFYKVGHHGSHNATLREKGLDQMEALRICVIPVDHDVALKMRWGDMPLEHLIEGLEERTKGRVLRTDIPPSHLPEGVAMTDLFYEIAI